MKARHRDRAAFLATSHDPLLETVTDRLLDRLEDCKRRFPHVAVLGGAGKRHDMNHHHHHNHHCHAEFPRRYDSTPILFMTLAYLPFRLLQPSM